MVKRGRLLNIMAKRCRICLINSGFMIKLRDKLVESKLKDLTRCTCIDIEYKKNLPDGVCHVCFYKLSMWAEFKELFIQSHKVLLEQLEKISEMSNAVNNSSENNRHLKRNIKKMRFNESDGDISPMDKKKSKTDMSEDTNVNTDEVIIDTISISDNGSTLSKDFLRKACDSNRRKLNKNVENGSKEHMESKSSLESKSSKFSRVRFKNKQRIAALKRWEERKKALCISTGKCVSDSDSADSNDMRLTSVQKTQTKDKEVKKQNKMKNILKQLKTDLTEKYIGFSDIDTPRTRLRNQGGSLAVSPRRKNNITKKTTYCSMKKESSLSSLAENNVTAIGAGKSISQTNDNTFTPKSSQTELVIGKTTFIVRSNLILQDQQCNQTSNSSKKNSEGLNGAVNGNSKEKNTDIIEAVQLRRVTPVMLDVKNDIERCLDIRIQSHEFTRLKHMQSELSDFIQKEMKHKLSSENKSTNKNITKTDSVNNTNLQPKLDENLKNLIQNAIEKNVERLMDGNDARHQGFQRVPPELVKAVTHLPQYQPKVVMERLDLANMHNNINKALKRAAPRNEFPRKRLVVLPRKYEDFNTSFNSDFSDLEDSTTPEPPGADTRAACPRTYSTTKRSKVAGAMVKQIKSNDSIVTTNKDNGAMSVSSLVKEDLMNGQKIGKNGIEIKDLTNTEFYMCGICKCTFNSQKDIQAHVRTSHTTTSKVFVMPVNNNTVTLSQSKQKKMRCKKCHEIVEYHSVKTHASTCKMTTQVYVCHLCDNNFQAKKLLLQHLETHNTSQMTNMIENKETNNVDASLESRIEAATSTTSQESQTVGLQLPTVFEALQKGLAIQTNKEGICVMPLKNRTNETNVQSTTMDEGNIQSDEMTATDAKFDVAKNVAEKNKEYTCFLCDKIFTDEEMLKDHLQQHCDDLSDGEQSDSRDLHKCTICDNILDSDQALEEHICKHWFDGEDNNHLNNTSLNDEKRTEDTSSTTEDEVHQCSECWELFDSQVLLELHTKVHVQEVPTAKPQEQVGYQYLCMLCDDLLDTEKDLAEHVNLHNGDAQVCQLCDKPFRTLEELQEHVTTHL